MKRSRIVLFLFGGIAILALLCAVFPDETAPPRELES